MIGQFRKELVSTDWINSRFRPENCFWAFNHHCHARNSLSNLVCNGPFCLPVYSFVHSMYTLFYLFTNTVTDDNACTIKHIFIQQNGRWNEHKCIGTFSCFAKKNILITGKQVNNNSWIRWRNIFSLDLWVPTLTYQSNQS